MKKRDRFDEIEYFLKRVTWLSITTLGFIGILLIAFKQFLDGLKSLW